MLKQMPSRNQRSNKAFKTKHFLQACLLLAICMWLLSQLKHTFEKNVREVGNGMMNKVLNEPGSVKLGRKDLHHEADGTTSDVGIEDEVESMSEDNEDEGGGGGDDEIDGRDQEKTEEEETELVVDDLIDVQDNDKEDEQEDDEVIQGQGKDHEAGGEHNKGNKGDVSNSVEQQQHRSRTI
ncbi:hypothetical protein ACFE04_007866 [Oxalis oulophora]